MESDKTIEYIYEIKIFDNHKIPKEHRGKKLFYSEKIKMLNNKDPSVRGMTKDWYYASSNKKSKSGRYKVPIIIDIPINRNYSDFVLYLYKSEFTLTPLKSERADD